MPAFLYVYVENADETYRRAIAAGAESIETPADTSYGRQTSDGPGFLGKRLADSHLPYELRRARLSESRQCPLRAKSHR